MASVRPESIFRTKKQQSRVFDTQLSSDVKVQALVLGVLSKESLKEDHHVGSNASLVRAVTEIVLHSGETGSSGLINVNDSGVLVPRVGIVVQLRRLQELLGDGVRTILKEDGQLGRATRSTSCKTQSTTQSANKLQSAHSSKERQDPWTGCSATRTPSKSTAHRTADSH
jgi:hypothetical protein